LINFFFQISLLSIMVPKGVWAAKKTVLKLTCAKRLRDTKKDGFRSVSIAHGALAKTEAMAYLTAGLYE